VLPPPPEYARAEQGIAAKQALSRLQRQGFSQITSSGDPASYTWTGVLTVAPIDASDGLRRYHWTTDLPEARAALESFWRLFSAIRVFRQLGTAQIVAVYMNILTGVLVHMSWPDALDTALADALADQLQVLNRDEQQIIEAFTRTSATLAFTEELRKILGRAPAGRRGALRVALREADQQRSADQESDIALDDTPLTDAQIQRVFVLGDPLALPKVSVFQRRLRDLAGERGL
jgi:5-methylcytosine-specific restriction enzyme B